MDNQFKNVKTHSRLLSKAMWYEWRMKLLDGLKDGLVKIKEDMDADEEILQHQRELLDVVLPPLVEQYNKVTEEESDLRTVADELANCDQEELSNARQKLIATEADIESKKRIIQQLRKEVEEKQIGIVSGTEMKHSYLQEIEEAEKVREACRGWTANEGLALKGMTEIFAL